MKKQIGDMRNLTLVKKIIWHKNRSYVKLPNFNHKFKILIIFPRDSSFLKYFFLQIFAFFTRDIQECAANTTYNDRNTALNPVSLGFFSFHPH